MTLDPQKAAAIILAGGESRRMGRPKPWLAFGAETLLQRVARLVAEAAAPVVVVAAEGQDLPPLPSSVTIARDTMPRQGPLQGLFTGLKALPDTVDLVYVTAVDLPFLVPSWIDRLVELSEGAALTIPRLDGRLHPLAALYRRAPALIAVEALLQGGRRRVLDLLTVLDVKVVDADEFRRIDPDLQTLRNLNTPEEYAQALRDAGLFDPLEITPP